MNVPKKADSPKKRVVPVNERGRRIGEGHPRAKLTDHEVDLIRDLAEDTLDPSTGKVVLKGLSMRQIAAKFDITFKQAARIVNCEQRAETPSGYRTVVEHER